MRTTPKIARRLTLAEVATLMGWTHNRDPALQAHRRLRRLERRYGVQLIHRGGGPNSPSWVSWDGLRRVGLVDDGVDVETVIGARDELAAEVADLRRQIRALARSVAALRSQFAELTPR